MKFYLINEVPKSIPIVESVSATTVNLKNKKLIKRKYSNIANFEKT